MVCVVLTLFRVIRSIRGTLYTIDFFLAHWTHRWHRRVICWCISQQARHRRDGTRLATRPRRRARRAPGPA